MELRWRDCLPSSALFLDTRITPASRDIFYAVTAIPQSGQEPVHVVVDQIITSVMISGKKARAAMERGAGSWDVCAFGAKGDGKTDDGRAIQSAIDACGEAGGGIVCLPPGTYEVGGVFTLGKNVTLRGAGGAVSGWGSATVLHAHDDAAPFISLQRAAGVRNLEVFYPDQKLKAGEVKPYPYTIKGTAEECHVIGVSLRNSYDGIDFTLAPQHLVRDVHGSPLNIGLYVDQCYDIGRIENVHYWPFNGPGENKEFYFEYLPHVARAFVFGRTDWEYVYNTFCWGYKVGYHFIETEHGSTNGNFLGIGADANEQCVIVDQAQRYTGGILITNGEFVPLMSDDCRALVVTEKFAGYLSLENCGVWGPSDHIATIAGNGRVSLTNCNFIQWDKNKRNAPAIECSGGVLTLSGNHFTKPMNPSAPHVALRTGTRGAVVMGNDAEGPWQVINDIGEKAQIGLNIGV